jgi:hypothetical protein
MALAARGKYYFPVGGYGFSHKRLLGMNVQINGILGEANLTPRSVERKYFNQDSEVTGRKLLEEM